jgi:PHP family Zn ribbon phosphoesterase
MRERLLARFGTEMDILHRAARDELAEAAGERIAETIIGARTGGLQLEAGGGGKYGKVFAPDNHKK